jgi:hypothetical protein
VYRNEKQAERGVLGVICVGVDAGVGEIEGEEGIQPEPVYAASWAESRAALGSAPLPASLMSEWRPSGWFLRREIRRAIEKLPLNVTFVFPTHLVIQLARTRVNFAYNQ